MPVEEKEYASKGVAGTGLGLGIAGTALALLNNNCGNGGLLGGLLGGNCHNNCQSVCSENTPVSRFELGQAQQIAILSERAYTDEKIADAYKQSVIDNNSIKEKMVLNNDIIFKALAENDKNIALNKQASDYQFMFVNKEFDCVNGRINHLTSRVDAITKEVVPLSAICPQPLAGCVPVGFNGQIVTTEPTKSNNTIISAKGKLATE